MTPISRRFIKASLLYLALGAILGIIMAVAPWFELQIRAVHAHIMLVGWVSMLMFGVAYHILPRFHGKMLYSDFLGNVHLWLANLGLIGMAFSMFAGSSPAVAIFGSLQTIGFFIFIYNIWRSIEPFTPPSGPVAGPPGPPS